MMGLLILIIALQTVIVAWMVFITLLMFSHDTELKDVQADKIRDYIDKVTDYADRVEKIVGEYQNVKKSAEETRDQTKRIQHDIQLQQAVVAMRPVDQPVFKYVEPEEDPEEPRS
ncbi:MAG: hypothetical protein IKE28_12035 [Solobacterium sp.]|nr:hypothetical protein [Solobacterium sp.]